MRRHGLVLCCNQLTCLKVATLERSSEGTKGIELPTPAAVLSLAGAWRDRPNHEDRVMKIGRFLVTSLFVLTVYTYIYTVRRYAMSSRHLHRNASQPANSMLYAVEIPSSSRRSVRRICCRVASGRRSEGCYSLRYLIVGDALQSLAFRLIRERSCITNKLI